MSEGHQSNLQDTSTFGTQNESPAKFLAQLKDQVMNLWMAIAKQQIEPASRIDESALLNRFPVLFDYIVEALQDETTERVRARCHEIASLHGTERANTADYNPDDLVQEYYLFCEVICDVLSSAISLRARYFHIIHQTVCMALRDSMISYSEAQTTFRERFIATLTHDLRNPIAAAKMAAELIGEANDDPDEVKELAERLKTNLKRADNMVQSLLDVAYMHSGYQLNYHMEPCDLNLIVSDIIHEMMLTHGDRFEIRGESIEGFWNKSAVYRAIENLISNALKYGDSKSPIVVAFKRCDGHVQIRVHNDGRPIPAADQKRIFQPFKREKTVLEARQGWGLGLCYVQSATEAHGGKVKVQSDASHGTDFLIELPIDSRH